MSWHKLSKKKNLSPLTQRSVNRITNLLKRQFVYMKWKTIIGGVARASPPLCQKYFFG